MRWTSLLVIVLTVARMVFGDCPKPPGGPNMQLITDVTFPAPDSTSVTFTCEVGYTKLGSGTVVCSGDQWSSLKLKCEIINCGSAGEVLNGQIDYSEGTEFGAYIHVTCNEGYSVVGLVNQLYCGSKGLWEGRLPECEVAKCDPPPAVFNGQFSPVREDYEHLEVVEYNCDKGYVRNGSKSLTCQENGQFLPVPPKCVSVNCAEPLITNGIQAAGSRPPFTHMSTVTFRCNEGNTMEGQDTASCDINSKWSPALPVCKATECDTPKIENGEVDNPLSKYKFRDTVTLKCSKGYTLSGQSTLECRDGNQWSAALPKCTLVQCPTPVVPGGVLVGALPPSFKYSDSVKYKCKPGHTPSGERTLTCDENGQWSPKLAECTLVLCRTPDVANGRLMNASSPSFKLSDLVVFECDSGYKMSGQDTLRCGVNSQWSSEPPQCTPSGAPVIAIVLGVLGAVAGLLCCGCCYYFGVLKKRKGKRGRPVAPA